MRKIGDPLVSVQNARITKMGRFSSPPGGLVQLLAPDWLAATQTDTTSNANDLATLLDKACLLAVTDFRAAATSLRSALPAEITSGILRYIGQRWSELDTGAIACTIYLLGEARSADDGAAAGWYALELGCGDDGVIIALADVVQSQSHPHRRASAIMRERLSIYRSTAFLVKLADHYRTEGHAFLA